MNSIKNNKVLIFPGSAKSERPKPSALPVCLDETRERMEKLCVELMYCRSESAVPELKFVTYLLDLACEALREALPPDDVGAAS